MKLKDINNYYVFSLEYDSEEFEVIMLELFNNAQRTSIFATYNNKRRV